MKPRKAIALLMRRRVFLAERVLKLEEQGRDPGFDKAEIGALTAAIAALGGVREESDNATEAWP